MSGRRFLELAASRRGRLLVLIGLLAVLALPGPGGGAAADGVDRGAAAALAGPAPRDGPAEAAAEVEAGADGPTADDEADDWRDRIASPFLRASGKFILAMLAFSQVFAVVRLVRGPTLADRVIALDFIGITCAAMIGVYSVVVEEPLYLRAAIVLSLVSFLGTVGFALYCEKRGVP